MSVKSTLHFTFCLFVLSISAFAQGIIPIDDWTVDLSAPAARRIDVTRGESRFIQPTVKYKSAAWAFPSGATVLMRYKTSNMTNTFYSITGSVYNATGGVLRVPWTPACEGIASAYQFEIEAATGTTAQIAISGAIFLKNSLGSYSAVTNPTNYHPWDSDITAISNIAVSASTNTADAVARATNVVQDANITAVSNQVAGKYDASNPSNFVTRTVTNGLLGAESDTLQSVAARGGFAGTETIGPLAVTSKRYGDGAGAGAEGDNWIAMGQSAGGSAVGNYWAAFGQYAGNAAVGSGWIAAGPFSGQNGGGNFWAALGCYAGFAASGNARLYIDCYESEPTGNNPTNDMIFGDNGQLNLGRCGPLTNASPNQLRGSWDIGTPTGSGASLTGITAAQVGAVTNVIINGQAFTVSSGMATGTVATGGGATNLQGTLDLGNTATNAITVGSVAVNGEYNTLAFKLNYGASYFGFKPIDTETVGFTKTGFDIFSIGNGGITFEASRGFQWTTGNGNPYTTVDLRLTRDGPKLLRLNNGGTSDGTVTLDVSGVVQAEKIRLGPLNAFLFSNGTNLFFVNVNGVTNAITSN